MKLKASFYLYLPGTHHTLLAKKSLKPSSNFHPKNAFVSPPCCFFPHCSEMTCIPSLFLGFVQQTMKTSTAYFQWFWPGATSTQQGETSQQNNNTCLGFVREFGNRFKIFHVSGFFDKSRDKLIMNLFLQDY